MAQTHRHQHVRGAYSIAAVEVGDRPRDAQDAVATAGTERVPLIRGAERQLSGTIEANVTACQTRIQLAVAGGGRGAVEPPLLPLTRGENALACSRRSGQWRRSELVLGRSLDGHEQIHPVEQWTAQPAAVASQIDLAAAAAIAHAGKPARTWVRRCHEHESGGQLKRTLTSNDHHVAVLQRLAKRIEARALEFRQLVQEEHAMMSVACFTRARWPSAADQPGRRDRVVGRAERKRRDQTPCMRAGDAVDPRDLDRLCSRQLGKDRWEPAGEHRLAGARGALEQQMVSARRGDLER
jgi:hypothetical protein